MPLMFLRPVQIQNYAKIKSLLFDVYNADDFCTI